ncbi:MAG: hypothetical protein CO141_03185 [Candidatus Moranbacteria bacterium CG_4_9_14_3_um_filter_42_9]|nr:MAG: hypothetical protein CO141_03185 [Candidatus Moranbacteria bacterium CG_4_9_14_3_um_filter_42_9]
MLTSAFPFFAAGLLPVEPALGWVVGALVLAGAAGEESSPVLGVGGLSCGGTPIAILLGGEDLLATAIGADDRSVLTHHTLLCLPEGSGGLVLGLTDGYEKRQFTSFPLECTALYYLHANRNMSKKFI